MKNLLLLISILAVAVLPAVALEGVCGKNGQTRPVEVHPHHPAGGSPLLADVEYSTGGAMETPATTGGAMDGWGTHFLTAWVNTTGQDVYLSEFGWPASGPGPVAWMVWITEDLPGAPGTQTFSGQWTPSVGDPDEFPPSTYAFVDVTAENMVIPAGASFYFGYENPGTGGQIDSNGIETFAWYEGAWDPDSAWARTALLQFKANFASVATERATLAQVKNLFR